MVSACLTGHMLLRALSSGRLTKHSSFSKRLGVIDLYLKSMAGVTASLFQRACLC